MTGGGTYMFDMNLLCREHVCVPQNTYNIWRQVEKLVACHRNYLFIACFF